MSMSNTRDNDNCVYFNFMLLCSKWENFEMDRRKHSLNLSALNYFMKAILIYI
jgi:hypothetical protein